MDRIVKNICALLIAGAVAFFFCMLPGAVERGLSNAGQDALKGLEPRITELFEQKFDQAVSDGTDQLSQKLVDEIIKSLPKLGLDTQDLQRMIEQEVSESIEKQLSGIQINPEKIWDAVQATIREQLKF